MSKICAVCYGKEYILEEFQSEYIGSKDFYKVPCKRCCEKDYNQKCQEINNMLAKHKELYS